MKQEYLNIRFPLWAQDEHLKPATLPFDQFAQYTDALRQLFVAIIDNYEDAEDIDVRGTVPAPVRFEKLEDGSAEWVLAVLATFMPFFDQIGTALQNQNLHGLDVGIQRALVRMNQTASDHGYGWGLTASEHVRVRIPPRTFISTQRPTIRCNTQFLATIIRIGGAEPRVRFEIAGRYGRLSSPISRGLAQRLTVYRDAVLSGIAEIEPTNMDILDFEVTGAKPAPDFAQIKSGLDRIASKAGKELADGTLDAFLRDE